MTDKTKRAWKEFDSKTIKKTIVYRILATLSGLVIGFAITSKVELGLAWVVGDVIACSIIYYVVEKIVK